MTMPPARGPAPWPAIAGARSRHGAPRVPFLLPHPEDDARSPGARPARPLGSVALPDLDALRAFPDAFLLRDAPAPQVWLTLPAGPGRDARLAEVHQALREQGRIRAWRDEPYPLRDLHGGEHGRVERAASRFWGLLTLGVHGNGYLADAAGRPTHLWIARRSFAKPTDPGRLDTLVGGGVPAGQSADEALVREGWEEAGLQPDLLAARVAGGVLVIDADIAEGRQVEWLHVFDLPLPAGWRPRAVDGEVHEHLCLPVDEALAHAASGEMTMDAALATLDFALRHRLGGRLVLDVADELAALRRGIHPGN